MFARATLDSGASLLDPSEAQRSEGSGFRVGSDWAIQNLEVQVRRILTLAVLTVAVAPVAAVWPTALAGASGTRAKLKLRHTSVGTILVNARGFTVYAFTLDSRNKDACQNIRLCLSVWPPVKTSGRPIAGPGVHRNLLGTIRLKNGAKQVTYAGHPLYTYIGDRRAGQTYYVNRLQFGGRWPAVNAAGHDVK